MPHGPDLVGAISCGIEATIAAIDNAATFSSFIFPINETGRFSVRPKLVIVNDIKNMSIRSKGLTRVKNLRPIEAGDATTRTTTCT